MAAALSRIDKVGKSSAVQIYQVHLQSIGEVTNCTQDCRAGTVTMTAGRQEQLYHRHRVGLQERAMWPWHEWHRRRCGIWQQHPQPSPVSNDSANTRAHKGHTTPKSMHRITSHVLFSCIDNKPEDEQTNERTNECRRRSNKNRIRKNKKKKTNDEMTSN